jgi:carbohydrate kinase (thermoresistant glucokinase family)
MGVSGCGKTTIGKLLAERLGWVFIEGDDYHSQANIQKMSGGIPLNDVDRWPWLEQLNELMKAYTRQDISFILSCSALKQSYRDLLKSGVENVRFVYLKGSFDLILDRMRNRQHYMKTGMLKSQFDTLEEPSTALVIPIDASAFEISEDIISKLKLE